MKSRENSIFWKRGDNLAELVISDVNMQKHIKKAAKKYDKIIIDAEPDEDNDYCLLALVPVDCIQFKIKSKRNYTPEQKKKRSEQMQKINAEKKQLINKA